MFGLDGAYCRVTGKVNGTRAVEMSLVVLSSHNHWRSRRDWSSSWPAYQQKVELRSCSVDSGSRGYYETVQSMIHMADPD